jgi:hypothetical protein
VGETHHGDEIDGDGERGLLGDDLLMLLLRGGNRGRPQQALAFGALRRRRPHLI